MTNPPLRLLTAFAEAFSTNPKLTLEVPGREMWLAAEPASEGRYVLVVPDLEARTQFDWRSARQKRTLHQRPLPAWAAYCAGTLLELMYDGLTLPGANLAIAGEEPAGPRYDYALGMAFATLAYHTNEQPCTADTLIALMERVRRSYF